MNVANENQLFFLVFFVGAAFTCFWLVFHYLKRARLIEDTPTSKIRSAAQGFVEIMGTVSHDKNQMLTAPLSGKVCVWYTYKIQRYKRSGKNSHWSTVEEKTSKHHFIIEDDTGPCTIDPKDAEVLTGHSRTWYGHTKNPSHINKINKTNILLRPIGGKRYRYIEKLIYAHDTIYALGNFQTNGGGRCVPNNHQMTGNVIREWKQNYDQILHRFDHDKNGEIDLLEWESVRTAASKEAEKRRQQLSQTPTTHTLGNSTNKQHPFILSTFSQKTLTKKYRCFAFFSLIGLACCTGFIFSELFNIHIITH